MLTSPELKDSITDLTTSKVALVGFTHRLADALIKALTAEGVAFHAVNEEQSAIQPDMLAVKLVFTQETPGGPLKWQVSKGMGYAPDGRQAAFTPGCVTTLADSELHDAAAAWAKEISSLSRHLVFRNLYVPKAVEMADGYNDLRVAFRFVRAWDPIYNQYVIRFDAVFKNLAA